MATLVRTQEKKVYTCFLNGSVLESTGEKWLKISCDKPRKDVVNALNGTLDVNLAEVSGMGNDATGDLIGMFLANQAVDSTVISNRVLAEA